MQDDMLIFIQSMIATVAENKRKEKKKIPLTAVRIYQVPDEPVSHAHPVINACIPPASSRKQQRYNAVCGIM
ncbi:hypothetical protein HBI56_084880 [Parastagonospora nodorum]|nr:hypothetical protein HBH47_080260 [Parastagonospora nodorum]KAH4171038.1 hypothetical protein HBH43_106690 [Parastagonospora nodorum]KAH4206130.1 hypothetical protein HBI95_124500 [Parastagonospora nodorum]KAH4843104.1 hypothetical protein HBH75_206870 [Parastagonospora nodorum]KAH5154824.1 hypothetical protein HBH69_112320 [Parastagonospora nodorum]